MKENYLRTAKNGVQTSEGFIPHREHPLGFMMPVKTTYDQTIRQWHRFYPDPKKDGNGNYVYALPGGMEFMGG